MFFFFFMQKTAYEMRISDWSSDVCSSDLFAKAIAHLDIDPSEINKVKRVQWHHVGELNAALKSLQQYATAQGFKPDYTAWHTHIAELKQQHAMNSSEERRVGKECVSTGRYRWSPKH